MFPRGSTLAMGLFLLLAGVSGALGQGEGTPTMTPRHTPKLVQALTGADLGKSLAHRFGCAACHSSDGRPGNGPTWIGLYGKEETLADGASVQVNEAYLRESIVEPDAKVVKGFAAGLMPKDFSQKLSGPDIQAIIDYIKTLW